VSVRWIDKLEEEWSVKESQMVTVPADEYRDLIHRVAEVERQLADTASFVQELADDLLERTVIPFPAETVA
jgi:hypothetical protein